MMPWGGCERGVTGTHCKYNGTTEHGMDSTFHAMLTGSLIKKKKCHSCRLFLPEAYMSLAPSYPGLSANFGAQCQGLKAHSLLITNCSHCLKITPESTGKHTSVRALPYCQLLPASSLPCGHLIAAATIQ